MADVASITAFMSSVRSIAEIAKAFHALKLDVQMQAKVIDLQGAVLAAQSAALDAQAEIASLMEVNHRLREELRRHQQDARGPASDYELAELGSLKVVVFKSKTDHPTHYACPSCMADGIVSVLQPVNGGTLLICKRQGCGAPFTLEPQVTGVVSIGPRTNWDDY
jgi:hypothetical protein